MQLRIERNVGFIVSPKTERAQQGDGLVTDDPDALDDRARVRVGMLKRALEIVHNGQPGGRYAGPLIRSRVNDLTLATLAHVVCVGECPAQAILQVGDPVMATWSVWARTAGASAGSGATSPGLRSRLAWRPRATTAEPSGSASGRAMAPQLWSEVSVDDVIVARRTLSRRPEPDPPGPAPVAPLGGGPAVRAMRAWYTSCSSLVNDLTRSSGASSLMA